MKEQLVRAEKHEGRALVHERIGEVIQERNTVEMEIDYEFWPPLAVLLFMKQRLVGFFSYKGWIKFGRKRQEKR